MRLRFRGQFTRSLDHKSRLAIPARLRHVLEAISDGEVVLTRGHDRSLEIYPLSSWEEFEDRELLTLPYTRIQARRFRRHFTFEVKEDKLDSQGRVLLPDFLKGYAGIKKDVVIVGEIDKITLWSPEVFSDFQKLSDKHFAQDSEDVDLLRRKDEGKR